LQRMVRALWRLLKVSGCSSTPVTITRPFWSHRKTKCAMAIPLPTARRIIILGVLRTLVDWQSSFIAKPRAGGSQSGTSLTSGLRWPGRGVQVRGAHAWQVGGPVGRRIEAARSVRLKLLDELPVPPVLLAD